MQLQDMGVKPFAILFAIIATGPIVAGVVLQRQAGTANVEREVAKWRQLVQKTGVKSQD